MPIEAIFEDIAERVAEEISTAEKTVHIAVAWLTNRVLFAALQQRAQRGCVVSVMVSDDAINNNAAIDLAQLRVGRSRVYKIGNGDTDLMHNKFCVIDGSTVITGSYNWTYKAERNFENIVIATENTALAAQFIAEFESIRKRYYPNEKTETVVLPIQKIVKRLEILKNCIDLEDIDDINTTAQKLGEFTTNTDLAAIVVAIEKQEYASAIRQIQGFIAKNQQLAVYADPEIAGLKLEVKILENQLNAYDNEKTDLEKVLSKFHHRHTIELGELLLKIFHLRKQKFKDDKEKYAEAEKDEQAYQEQFETAQKRTVHELTESEKTDLKKKYRKASLLCHPDRFEEQHKAAATAAFIALKNAYDANDIAKVTEILASLENGNYFVPLSDAVSTKTHLKAAIATLRQKIATLESEIIALKTSETYQEIIAIADWDAYFTQTKADLQAILTDLRR
jgi:hypothetical protein